MPESWRQEARCRWRGSVGPVVTLVFVGRRRRQWGFSTPQGWKPWNEYLEDIGKRVT